MCIPFFYILLVELGNNGATVKLMGHSVRLHKALSMQISIFDNQFLLSQVLKIENSSN